MSASPARWEPLPPAAGGRGPPANQLRAPHRNTGFQKPEANQYHVTGGLLNASGMQIVPTLELKVVYLDLNGDFFF